MRMIALAAAALALSACGGGESGASTDEANALTADNLMMGDDMMLDGNASMNGMNGMDADAPIPPPDAVSHPDGYLPPAPAEPDPASANSSRPDSPATEDEYIRNRQAGR